MKITWYLDGGGAVATQGKTAPSIPVKLPKRQHERFAADGFGRTMSCFRHFNTLADGTVHNTMSLTQAQKKEFRSAGHRLSPVVTVAENGLSESVMAELERALNDHELIKIKLALTEREHRRQLIEEMAQAARADILQVIGKTALLYRANPQANPRLSNVVRARSHHGRH